MRTAAYYALCAIGMTGFYALIHYFIVGVSVDFGHGFFVGIALATVLFWLNEKIDGKHKRQ